MSDRPSNETAIERAMARYVRRRLIDDPAANFRLIKPSTGVKSFVRVVEIDSQPRQYVLRALSALQNSRLRRRLKVEQILTRHNLSAPRLLSAQRGVPLLRPAIIAEERLIGRHLQPGEWTVEGARQLADVLAAYHAVHSTAHGDIARPSRRAFGSLWMQRVRNRLREIQANRREGYDWRLLERTEAWLAPWREQLDAVRRFDLIHDKLNPGNVMVLAQAPGVALLDFETLQFGSRVKDIVQARYDVLFDEAEPCDAFLQRYRSHQTEEEWRQIEALMPFFALYQHVSTVAAALKRRKRKKDFSPMGPRFQKHWKLLEEALS